MSLLIAPTEPPLLKSLGTVTGQPEKCGVDVLWAAYGGLVGVQRKEVKDLLASIENGRLNTELAKARSRLKATWLLVEGEMYWDRDGKLGGKLGEYYGRWTRHSFQMYLNGIQASGVWVAFTKDLTDTCAWVEQTQRWSLKEKHDSLHQRPNPKGKWGTADSKEWLAHVLCGFEGISTGRANAILKSHPIPLMWTMTEEEMQAIPGIGPKLAAQLTRALQGGTVSEPEG